MAKKGRHIAKRKHLTNVGYGKTGAAVVGGAVSTVVVYIFQAMGHALPAEATAAVQTVVTTVVVFFTQHTLFTKP
jgi:CDP-diglyceride synthetase